MQFYYRYNFFKLLPQIIIYSSILFIGTIIFWITDLDHIMINPWYQAVEYPHWIVRKNSFLQFIHLYGTFPSIFLLIFAIIKLLYSYLKKGFALQRVKCLCIILTIIIGPGLFVNIILKPAFSRPRPFETQHYGEKSTYNKVLIKGEDGESFPSGHASAGFLFTIFFYLFYPSNKKKAWAWMIFGLLFGSILGYIRIMQGCHYPSDILWSFGVTQLSHVFIYFKLLNLPSKESQIIIENFVTPNLRKKCLIYSIIFILLILPIILILISRPITYHKYIPINIPKNIQTIIINSNLEKENFHIYQNNHLKQFVSFDYLVLGMGFPKYNIQPSLITKIIQNNKLHLNFNIQRTGLFIEYSGRIAIKLPKSSVKIIKNLTTKKGNIEYK